MSETSVPYYKIIEGSIDWADKYREFCRAAYEAAYVNPERGITKDLFSTEVFSSPRIVKYFQAVCANTPTNKTWLAVDDNQKLIGVVSAHLYPEYCDMKAFYVKREYRGQGIGHALYEKVLDYAGPLPMQVDVIEYMQETIDMYKHWGFTVDKSKGTLNYDITEWPERARQAYQAIYMVKPAPNDTA